MQRVTTMKKPWIFLQKILAGMQTIEIKWHKRQYAPWDGLNTGDLIYFRAIESQVTIKAKIKKVIQYSSLTPDKIQKILLQYGRHTLGIDDLPAYFKTIKNNQCCVLFFLENAQKIDSFEIE